MLSLRDCGAAKGAGGPVKATGDGQSANQWKTLEPSVAVLIGRAQRGPFTFNLAPLREGSIEQVWREACHHSPALKHGNLKVYTNLFSRSAFTVCPQLSALPFQLDLQRQQKTPMSAESTRPSYQRRDCASQTISCPPLVILQSVRPRLDNEPCTRWPIEVKLHGQLRVKHQSRQTLQALVLGRSGRGITNVHLMLAFRVQHA